MTSWFEDIDAVGKRVRHTDGATGRVTAIGGGLATVEWDDGLVTFGVEEDFIEMIDERPTLGQRGIGYLDGILGLPMQTTADDEYLIGHMHGAEMREKVGDL